jgi:hypothetical protein
VKLMLTTGAMLLLMVHMTPILRLSALAAEADLAPGEYGRLRWQLVADAALALLVLLATATLGVYKPWGRTRYGLRRVKAAAPLRSAQADRPWGLYVVIGLVAIVVLAIANHLFGGGHGRH